MMSTVQAICSVAPKHLPVCPPQLVASDYERLGSATAYDKIHELEGAIAQTIGIEHVILVNSGTAALHVIMAAMGIGPGDTVAVPALTFAGAAAAVCYTGAQPVFVDCRLDPLGSVNAFKLHQWLATVRPKPRALIAVDLLGHPGVDEELVQTCLLHGVLLIEDAAAALGTGRCGTWGEAAVLSFNHNKIVTMGGGGAVLTRDKVLAAKARSLATTAKRTSLWHYEHTDVGFNYRPHNLGAAIALNQIKRLPELIRRKLDIHRRYSEVLFEGLGVQLVQPRGKWNGWLSCMLIDPRHAYNAPILRDEIMAALYAEGRSSRALFMPLHLQVPYATCGRQPDLGIAVDLWRRAICLPS